MTFNCADGILFYFPAEDIASHIYIIGNSGGHLDVCASNHGPDVIAESLVRYMEDNNIHGRFHDRFLLSQANFSAMVNVNGST
ncbi:hypothetical protein N7530_010148 [Penicillium desertorum]|uniref:Uncharacterized protein n=1 Tax=Penicillium desertorum TaxID=1303715 RepID=A0A9X0BJ27_9EURO|nr:hypothetical protein N7530_010148 [Penicillium desertorum]